MAKVSVKMPEELLTKMSKLGSKTDAISARVLEAGGKVILRAAKTNLQQQIGKETKKKSRSTGELLSALGLTPVKVGRDGNYNIKLGFKEPRKDGGVNAKIANILEYGKHGQPAKPFLEPAKRATKKACIEAMTRKLEEEVGKL